MDEQRLKDATALACALPKRAMQTVMALIAEVRRLQQTVGEMREAEDVLHKTISTVSAERDAALAERHSYATQLERVTGERDKAEAAIEWTEKAARLLQCQKNDADLRIDQLERERDAALAERDALREWSADFLARVECADFAEVRHKLAALTEARRVLRECHEVLANHGYITDDDDPESLCARIASLLAREPR